MGLGRDTVVQGSLGRVVKTGEGHVPRPDGGGRGTPGPGVRRVVTDGADGGPPHRTLGPPTLSPPPVTRQSPFFVSPPRSHGPSTPTTPVSVGVPVSPCQTLLTTSPGPSSGPSGTSRSPWSPSPFGPSSPHRTSPVFPVSPALWDSDDSLGKSRSFGVGPGTGHRRWWKQTMNKGPFDPLDGVDSLTLFLLPRSPRGSDTRVPGNGEQEEGVDSHSVGRYSHTVHPRLGCLRVGDCTPPTARVEENGKGSTRTDSVPRWVHRGWSDPEGLGFSKVTENPQSS